MSSTSSYDRDDVIVKGDDGTANGKKISQVQDGSISRLAVDTKQDVIASSNTIPICAPLLLDGTGTKEMDVDGSSTVVNFSWTPSSGVWYLDVIRILIQDGGSADVKDFGSISNGLSTGLKIEIKSEGSVYEIANLKDNGDIVNCFTGSSFGVGANESVGFLDDDDTFIGDFKLPERVKIDSSQSDYVRFIVRDNVSALSYLRSSVTSYKVI